MVDLLLANGADLNCRNEDEETSLLVMVKKKRLNCIVALVSNGADVSVINKDGRNSLHLAVEVGSVLNDLMEVLCKHVKCNISLSNANFVCITKAEDIDIVKALLLFGVNCDLKDSFGFTALDLADQKQQSALMDEIKRTLKIFSSIQRGRYLDNSDIILLLKYILFHSICASFFPQWLMLTNVLL